MNVFKKEQIKDRLIRLAAERWNVQESEVDANFDPLMLLLFDALASELEGIGHLIKDIQGNLLQELSGLMLPNSLLNAKPASCILSSLPSEDVCEINKLNNFSTVTQVQKPGDPLKESDVNFTPVGTFKLLNVQLTHLKIGGKTFKYNPDGRKMLLHEDGLQEYVQEIHFALHNPSGLNSLEGLQIFFDLKGHSEARNFYYFLQQGQLLINTQPASFNKGYYQAAQFDTSLKDAMRRSGDYSRKIQREVAGIYANQFISVTSGSITARTDDTVIPMLQNMPAPVVQELHTPQTIYITLKMGKAFPAEVLERMQLGVNAFPAINRTLDHADFKTDRWINIVPLKVNGSYLDIENIESADGVKYRLHENAEERELKEGEAIVRLARVGKNSSAQIRNTIQGLLESIKDESAYFSRISNDFIATRLNEISKILVRLEDQVDLSTDEKSSFRYVLLKPHKQRETIHVYYWTTTPKDALFVKAAQVFKPIKHTLTKMNSTFSLTPAVGGVDTHSEYAQKQMLVRQLASGGKLISAEDIKLLCYELFGPKLKSVAVGKSMRVLPGKNQGISRVINVDITVNKQNFGTDELTHIERQLHYHIETKASFVFPFIINIIEES